MNQSEFKANTCNRRQAQESACERGSLVLVLHLIAWESGASFINQSQSVVMQNQSKNAVAFDTQLKTALSHALTKYLTVKPPIILECSHLVMCLQASTVSDN